MTVEALARLALAPEDAAAWSEAGEALDRHGRHDEAHAALAEAHRLAPVDAAFAARFERAEVEARLRRQLVHEPRRIDVRLELARRLRERHRPLAARDVLLGAVDDDADDAEVLSALAVCHLETGDQDAARRCAERSAARMPRAAPFHQLLCSVMAYQDGVSGAELTAALRRCASLWPRPAAPVFTAYSRDPPQGGRLRLGVLGGAFRRHPTTLLTLPAFEHVDRDAFELHCFAPAGPEDALTARWKAIAVGWHAIDADPAATAARIAAAGIDVLIDLGGALGVGQIAVLPYRPAPLQVKWVGAQFHTTGLPEVDALVTDRFETPADLAHLYVERLLLMPGSYVCYDPPTDPPPAGRLREDAAEVVTFGSFNALMKITPRVLDTWSAILHRVPFSRLLFEDSGVRGGGGGRRGARGVRRVRHRPIARGCRGRVRIIAAC